MNAPVEFSRRDFLKAAGALVVSFGIPLESLAQQADPRQEALDAWLAVGGDGKVTVYCGKVELGTGVETALSQIVADELDVAFERIKMVMGDTDLCPNQGPTVGSLSIYRGGPQLRQAAAEARHALLGMAAARLGVPAEQLRVADGVISGPQNKRTSYAELIGNRKFDRKLSRAVKPKAPGELRVVGKPIPRVDIPGKIFGTHAYIQNVRMKGLMHARVIRAPLVGATLEGVDRQSVESLPPGARIVTKGNFLAVVAEREEQAVRAARMIKARWKPGAPLPEMGAMPAALRSVPATDKMVASAGDVDGAMKTSAKTHRAEYYVPFQNHGSIGPSCAIADVRGDSATVWSPTQSSFLTRGSIAGLLGLPPERVRVIWIEGAGCYGQNGADDCSGDAALVSQLIGKPVRLQWMRWDEHCHEPKGVAMTMEVSGGLDARGDVVAWDYQVWSANHSSRPFGGAGGNLIAGAALGMAKRDNIVGADRNAKNSYAFPNSRVRLHLLQSSAIRVSSFRGLGSPQNTFANESFIDELAALAGEDPLRFRVRHLKDERAIAVLEEVEKLSRWERRPSSGKGSGNGTGRGVAFVHYDNYSGYVGMVVQVQVDRATGKVGVQRVFAAHDCGLIVNPDGLKNQIEGNIVQALSRALHEEVSFDREKITSLDWARYPIIRFSDVPQEISISLINRPDKPSVGAGEPATSPVMAAVANAIFDATGVRLRSVPFTPARLKTALTRA